MLFFFNDTATTEIYTLSLHDALPILVIKVYGSTNASKLRISFNDLNNNDIGYVVEVKEGEWNSFSLPLRDEQFWGGAPQDEVSVIVIQEFSNMTASEYIYYVDDFGFL